MADKTKGFDFAALDGHLEAQEAGSEITIMLPNGKATDLKIFVAGADSERVKKALRWNRDQLTSRADLSDEAREDIEVQTSARCCVGWSGATYQGKEVPFSVDEAAKWFKKWPFMQRQVSQATGSLGRFIPA